MADVWKVFRSSSTLMNLLLIFFNFFFLFAYVKVKIVKRYTVSAIKTSCDFICFLLWFNFVKLLGIPNICLVDWFAALVWRARCLMPNPSEASNSYGVPFHLVTRDKITAKGIECLTTLLDRKAFLVSSRSIAL